MYQTPTDSFLYLTTIRPPSEHAERTSGLWALAGINITARIGLTCALCLACAFLCPPHCMQAQVQGAFSIHVESNLVVVPVNVLDERRTRAFLSPKEVACLNANARALGQLSATEPYLPVYCDVGEIRGLATKDFHVFEDGVEQKIQSVNEERDASLLVRDSDGLHSEWSETPKGIWSRLEPHGISGTAPNIFYKVAYASSNSKEDGCHQVKVQVARRHALVFSRGEYCSNQGPSDVLNGTALGKEMEADLSLSSGGGRAYIALNSVWEFPGVELRREKLAAALGVMGLVSGRGGGVFARFSDIGCCRPENPALIRTQGPVANLDQALDQLEGGLRPIHYEQQLDLPSGEYVLGIVLSDGDRFGRAEMPLTIDAYDGKQIGISSVLLCKRFRDAHVAAVERAAANFAPQYVPLVSKGIEFTPTGDTRFKKGEPLIPYFEVYEPLLATESSENHGIPASAGMTSERAGATMPAGMTTEGAAGATPEGMTIPGNGGGNPSTTLKVEAHIRILDAKTGKVVKDFPPVDATPYMNPGSTTIPIARKIPYEELPKGAYRLEVQATDSAGRSTAVRTADFTVE
jgi:hypothetical protein